MLTVQLRPFTNTIKVKLTSNAHPFMVLTAVWQQSKFE